MLEHRTSLSAYLNWACLLGDLSSIHLVTQAVTPFLLMVGLPHDVLQVANKCILEVTGLDIVQTTVLCQAHLGLPIPKKGLLNSSQKSTELSKALARDVGPTCQA